jgi:hypothetical protein
MAIRCKQAVRFNKCQGIAKNKQVLYLTKKGKIFAHTGTVTSNKKSGAEPT